MENSQPEGAQRPWLPAVLLALTVCTTFAAGLYATDSSPFLRETWTSSDSLVAAAAYAVCVLGILGTHEMGHYLSARKLGVGASWPHFLPGLGPIPGADMIVPFIGTFGAVIRIDFEPMKAAHLLRIGAMGPIAGFVVTVPVVFLGMGLSETVVVEPDVLLMGDPLLILLAEWVFFPGLAANEAVMLHPVGLAGWVGCLLTALNLLPVAQLDGGHIAYSIFGRRYRLPGRLVLCALVAMGIFVFPGWLVLVAFILVMGVDHPDLVRGELVPPRRAASAWLCLVIFAVCFVPQPIEAPSLLEMIGLF